MDFELGIDGETLFGECKFCGHWVPRGEMKSINANVYGSGYSNVDRVMRFRMCQKCSNRIIEGLEEYEWENKLYCLSEIKRNRSMADNCQYVE